MRSETTKYVLGFIAAIGLIVVVIVLLVRSLFSAPSQNPAVVPQMAFTNYADTATTVQLTVDSPITAPTQHHDIIINVGNVNTVLTITQGYDGEVVRSHTYPMSVDSYRVFLAAIFINGFTQGGADPSAKDERGHCALGDRFIYEVIDPSGQTTQRYWSTSCGSGTFNGESTIIRTLFRTQVPDYFQETNDIQL